MPPPDSITRRAYAKVNLALGVGPPEPPGSSHPGWHRIASWVHAINLFDEVLVERPPAGQGSRYSAAWAPDAPFPSPIDWPAERDLAARAHRLLEERTGRTLPADLRVTKRIPVGGGLGGGSSDAAAALLAINELFELGLSAQTLARWSRALGSDVPFFVDESPPRPAFVAGFGDRVERMRRAAGSVVLIVPPFGCATPAAYRAFDALGAGELDEARARALADHLLLEPAALFNDLQAAAEAIEPRLVALARRAQKTAGAPVHISGSGSTLFVVGDQTLSRRLASALEECAVIRTDLV